MKIALLLPTRKRPDNLIRFYESVANTADDPENIEIIVYIDEDDASYDKIKLQDLKKVRGPRIVLSEMWNKCYEKSKADILGHMGDDIIFQTKGWDTVVRSTFDEYDDKIVFLYGDDGGPHTDFGTHGFIHRKWAEAVGYFVPPYFSSDYNDTWLNDVAKLIGRHRRIDIFTEHMHPAFNKAELDITHQERLTRHRNDHVDELYRSEKMYNERENDADKLRRTMNKKV